MPKKNVKRKAPGNKPTKKVKPVANAKPTSQTRQLKTSPKRFNLNLNKRLKNPARLPSAFVILKTTAKLLWDNRTLFISLTIIYGVLNLILVQGLASSSDISSLKSQFTAVFNGHLGNFLPGLGSLAELLTSAGNTSSQTAGAYQFILAIISSLAVIWSLRRIMSGSKVKARDAFYRGMYPLVPFLLILLLILVQLIPLVLGGAIYSTVTSSSIATSAVEQIIFLIIFIIMAGLSFYWVSCSIMALYIITLVDMTPMKALRSAKNLVRYRRWTVIRKILALPVALLIVAAIIMLPIIFIVTALAQWVFFLLTMFALVAVNAYLYVLYRELLNE